MWNDQAVDQQFRLDGISQVLHSQSSSVLLLPQRHCAPAGPAQIYREPHSQLALYAPSAHPDR